MIRMVLFGLAGLIVGILLLLFGAFMVIGFPGSEEHQPYDFSVAGIVIGFVCLAIGVVLVFG